MANGLAAPINTILTCEKVAQVPQILLYFFPWVGVAFRYDCPDHGSSSFSWQADVGALFGFGMIGVAGAQAGAALGSTRRQRAM